MTYQEAYQSASDRLAKAGVTDAAIDAGYLLEYVSGMRHIDYVFRQREEMPQAQLVTYQKAVQKRSQRIPLQQITGEQEFMGLTFRVTEDVLCPRQDTEILVEQALERIRPGMRILDLCTGSGCILISLLALSAERREKLQGKREGKNHVSDGTAASDYAVYKEADSAAVIGVGCDISPEALAVARENARRNQVDAQFIQSDLFSEIKGTFDMIVSNPPYIPSQEVDELMPEVRDHEPRIALDGDSDGLAFYQRIIPEAVHFLRPGGWLLFEIGYDEGDAVRTLMRENAFLDVEVIQDYGGNDRVVLGHL